MKIYLGSPACLLLFMVCVTPALVSADINFDDPGSIFEHKEVEGWKEEALKIPPLPEKSSLLPIEVDKPGFNYFIDEKSVSTGTSDRVTRYIVVIESSGGTRNILYEALNCPAVQYKTYAYSINGQPFQVMKDPKWQSISPLITQNYRAELYRIYLCSNGIAVKTKKEMIQRIKYPPVDEFYNQ